MPLTTAQLIALRTDITVTRAAVLYLGTSLLTWWNNGANGTLADFYNQVAVAAVPLWRPEVPGSLMMTGLVWTEFNTGIAAGDVSRRTMIQTMLSQATWDTTVTQVRTNYTAIAGATTLINWNALAKRNATYLEALYAGAPVSGASVTTVFNTLLTSTDVWLARTA